MKELTSLPILSYCIIYFDIKSAMNNEHTKILQGEQKLNEIENEIEKFKKIFYKNEN